MNLSNLNLKRLVIVLSFITCLLSVSIVYVYAQNGDIFTISSGIYPGAPSFTVWREGSTYYAKDEYGGLVSGTSASTIINNCLLNGTKTLLKVGTYELDSPLEIKNVSPNRESGLTLEGEIYSQDTRFGEGYAVKLRPTASFPTNGSLIRIEKNWYFTQDGITVRNLALTSYGGGKNEEDVRGIYVYNSQVTTVYVMGPLLIENIYFEDLYRGLHIDGSIFNCLFRNLYFYISTTGYISDASLVIEKTANDNPDYCHSSHFQNIWSWVPYWHLINNHIRIIDAIQTIWTSVHLLGGNFTVGGWNSDSDIGAPLYFGNSQYFGTWEEYERVPAYANIINNLEVMDIRYSGDATLVFNNCSLNTVKNARLTVNYPSTHIHDIISFKTGAWSNYVELIPYHRNQYNFYIDASTALQTPTDLLNEVHILPPAYRSDLQGNAFHLDVTGNVRLTGCGVENKGDASVSNNDWIAHELWDVTPDVVLLTPRSNVAVWVNARNSTHFQVGVSAGTITVDWEAYFSGY